MRIISILFLFFLFPSDNDKPVAPEQASSGPGGQEYLHNGVRFSDFAESADGYWLFEPAQPLADSAQVIVFTHGYGAYNPMIYGAWIKHLVRQGYIVIFPRYQKNLISPWPSSFFENTAQGIKAAYRELEEGQNRVRPTNQPFIMVGHSYGGTIAAYLSVKHAEFDLPAPAGLMLCAPGTGPFRAGRLDSYEAMPSCTNLLMVINEEDNVVGQDFQYKIFETAKYSERRNLLIQHPDDYGYPSISATHSECYAVDLEFDTGTRTPSARRALGMGDPGPLDYFGYWKLLDALIDCVNTGDNCSYAFGATEQQMHLGTWSDGQEIRPFEVFTK